MSEKYGIPLIWGYDPAPELPAGWDIERTATGPAVAVSPNGEHYLIGETRLFPWLVCPVGGLPNSTLKPGQRYIFRPGSIPIPTARLILA